MGIGDVRYFTQSGTSDKLASLQGVLKRIDDGTRLPSASDRKLGLRKIPEKVMGHGAITYWKDGRDVYDNVVVYMCLMMG